MVLSLFKRRSLIALPGALLLAVALLWLGLIPLPRAQAALPTTTHAWWHLETSATPTDLPPGGEDEIMVIATNLGDEAMEAAANTVTIADTLPAGLKGSEISSISGKIIGLGAGQQSTGAVTCTKASLSCTFSGTLASYGSLQVTIAMKEVALDARSGEENEVTVTGGGALPVSLRRPLAVSSAPTPFGVENYELTPENEDGSLDTQAGSHPFQLTATIALNRTAAFDKFDFNELFPQPVSPVKDQSFKWPAGLIGNPTPLPRCTAREFAEIGDNSINGCPPDTAVGVASLTFDEPINFVPPLVREEVPLFSVEPERGEPARFGFEVDSALVLINPSIRTGGDYGITVSVHDITELVGFLSATVTTWGVPDDPRHDPSRGWACLKPKFDPAGCAALDESQPPPFLTLPTSCTGPLQTSVEADTWADPDDVLSTRPSEPMPAMTGCNHLQFEPEITAVPDGQQASRPSGLGVDVHVPQEGQLNPTGLAQSNIKDIRVTLPEGVSLNPAGANGLEACSEGLVGYLPGESSPPSELHFTSYLPGSIPALAAGDSEPLEPGVNFCPNASKIGTVKITTPLLPNPLEGEVYLAAQNANPFGSLVAMYIVAEDPVSGSLVKLPGQVTLNQSTGQIEATFENTPQLPFEDAELHFFGGETAPLSTPAYCGAYTTNAVFTPWSGNEAVNSSSSFQIVSGPNGSACPGSRLPFSPSLAGGATNVNAGAFSPFTLSMSRQDGEQNMQSVEAHLPPGLSGVLSTVELCPEPQADLGECPQGSLIGESTVSVGVGGDPYSVSGGKIYLTGPYNGSGACTVGTPGCAPFGLTFEVPAKAGPFDLKRNTANPAGEDPCDCVIVRGKIEINPETAALTITSDPPGSPYAIPTSIEGIPLEIQRINAITTRSNFQFNPTSCNKMQVTGTIYSSEGAIDTIAVPFQVTNCKNLNFTPKFAVSTGAKTSKADGASLTAKVTEPAGSLGTQANLARVKVELPKQLPSRLTTLQKACTDAQFNANPAGCPPESDIGHATVHTPLLSVPLTGPVIFVSHGGEAFPSLTMVLQGDGVTIDLVGDLYVAVLEKEAVDIYSPSGTFLTEFTTSGNGVEPTSIAVDSSGDVYVTGYDDNVMKYKPKGGAFPPTASTEYEVDTTAGAAGVIVEGSVTSVAVDPKTNDVYIAEGGHVSEYEPDGTPITTTIGSGVSDASYVGVDVYGANGDVYATDSTDDEVYVFNPAGTVVEATISGTTNPHFPTGFGTLETAYLAVDQSDGDVYVSDLQTHRVVDQFTASGAFVSQIGPEFGSEDLQFSDDEPSAIAVDNGASSPNDGDVYITSYERALASEKGVYAFGPLKYTLNVTTGGLGTGAIECEINKDGSFVACEQEYPEGTEVSLEGTADSDSTFAGWSDGSGSASSCTGTSNCTFTIKAPTGVTATFNPNGAPKDKLTINRSGTGEVRCEVDKDGGFGACATEYDEGVEITLKGVGGSGSTFEGWSGGAGSASSCTGTGNCTFILDETSSVTATFGSASVTEYTLTVAKLGEGAVTSIPSGIGCGIKCSQVFPYGEQVELEEAPAAGFEFAGWIGCKSAGATCKVEGTRETEVTAVFFKTAEKGAEGKAGKEGPKGLSRKGYVAQR